MRGARVTKTRRQVQISLRTSDKALRKGAKHRTGNKFMQNVTGVKKETSSQTLYFPFSFPPFLNFRPELRSLFHPTPFRHDDSFGSVSTLNGNATPSRAAERRRRSDAFRLDLLPRQLGFVLVDADVDEN